ncbi:MAG: tyrosine--tRNA ligase [Flavobacteriales bacterium]|nr:tyrosine--tRNA ligase [Flavobacteriales bacterium]
MAFKPNHDLIEELKWRGLLHDSMPETQEMLNREMVTGYVGFDPTSDSLHIGNLVPIMLLKHLQLAGHKPIALVGGATGMIGDPSGKSAERNLLDEETLRKNQEGVRNQLLKFLDFENGENHAESANNYDWFKGMSFLQFMRDIGKHITVSYMMSKDSVQNRLETGLSFTEFSYQLVQGYDFAHLLKTKGVKLQMGGSDQWGNIVTGTELIRRMGLGEAKALVAPLITKADGGKFGKTESGNVWLDPNRTSPYQFYQFWLNASDEDAKKYIRIFSLLPKADIEAIEAEHNLAPHARGLQKALAKDVTTRVHSEDDYNAAVAASEILFGKGTEDSLRKLSETDLLSIFDGVPQFEVAKSDIEAGILVIDFMTDSAAIFPSKGEARKMIQGNGVSINQNKVESIDLKIDSSFLIAGKYILAQRGKKNYFLIKAV